MSEQAYKCGECGTTCKHALGIGHYCPNDDCPVVDGPGLIEINDGDGTVGKTTRAIKMMRESSLPGLDIVSHETGGEETENPWAYLDDYRLTGDPENIRSADQHRQDLLDEVNWMVATGQNAAVARVATFAHQINKERDGEER